MPDDLRETNGRVGVGGEVSAGRVVGGTLPEVWMASKGGEEARKRVTITAVRALTYVIGCIICVTYVYM